MRFLLTYSLCFFVFWSFSQNAKVEVNPSTIEVGATASLKIKVELPNNASYRYKAFDAVVPARKKDKSDVLVGEPSNEVEVLDNFFDTIYIKDKKKIWEGVYQITVWNEGVYEVEGGTFFLDDSTITLPTATISVNLVATQKGNDLYDIDEHFADLPPADNIIIAWLKSYYWIVLILLALVFLFWRWKKVNRQPKAPTKLISLKERTLMAVDHLEKERMWEKGKLKEHYIELSFILRSYLSSRYELNLLEKTTPETKLLLKQAGLHPETIESIELVLSQSDLVKFAKSQPQEIEILKISQRVRMIVTETSPLEFDNAE